MGSDAKARQRKTQRRKEREALMRRDEINNWKSKIRDGRLKNPNALDIEEVRIAISELNQELNDPRNK